MPLNIAEAYRVYSSYINNGDLFAELQESNLTVPGSVASRIWELFGAALTGAKATAGYGADLEDFEVKSSKDGCAFEYQYHLNGGLAKLEEDKNVHHIFISYSPDYTDIDVRLVPGNALANTFESWKPGLVANYEGENRKLRYRKSISYSTVVNLGTVVMQIRGGELVQG